MMTDTNGAREQADHSNPKRERGEHTNPQREQGVEVADNVHAANATAANVAAEQIDELKAQLAEADERTLRVQAELENYRKRMQREMADERRYAVVPLVRDLLAVVDNLERAIEAAETTGGSEGLLAGVKMVASQFEQVLAQHQCKKISAVGEPFDPHQHEALAQEPSDQYPAGTVSRETQVGYKLYDRVIRPAQVFVSTGPASA